MLYKLYNQQDVQIVKKIDININYFYCISMINSDILAILCDYISMRYNSELMHIYQYIWYIKTGILMMINNIDHNICETLNLLYRNSQSTSAIYCGNRGISSIGIKYLRNNIHGIINISATIAYLPKCKYMAKINRGIVISTKYKEPSIRYGYIYNVYKDIVSTLYTDKFYLRYMNGQLKELYLVKNNYSYKYYDNIYFTIRILDYKYNIRVNYRNNSIFAQIYNNDMVLYSFILRDGNIKILDGIVPQGIIHYNNTSSIFYDRINNIIYRPCGQPFL